ncbi:hypothetical protein FRC03_009306 [Tulasnella sp. 419]|nr:hypothetical protein FRC02_002511 [Tulasnella sp. 418]KAG8958252.1 hypothetical protein FRC03_009306 [Tulasnella sp. 419]
MYRLLCSRFPRLGVQPFVKALCDSQGRVYDRYLRVQLSNAFDAYLGILRVVDRRLNSALDRDAPNWRVLNACAACHHRIEDEEPLEYEYLINIDGNNSLKRFGGSGKADNREFSSDYILPRASVEEFANVVTQTSRRLGKKGQRRAEENGNDEDEVDVQAELHGSEKETGIDDSIWASKGTEHTETILEGIVSVCVERWKANADDHKKGMFGCFQETGVFLAACRHGRILSIVDMVNSGELAKYPLAILAHLDQLLPGKKLVGYDIGCATTKTLSRSKLGDKAQIRFVIPSMHGYAHNRPCQLSFHPKYVGGTGIEDFEGCERIFSASNACAAVTRYSSSFHRHQRIDLHFRQWDADKLLSIGTFIADNYKQALTVIAEYGDIFSQVQNMQHIAQDDFERWNEEEKTYLAGLSKEPEEETMAIMYVKALDDLRAAEESFESSNRTFQRPVQADQARETKRTVTLTYKAALDRVNRFSEVVETLEARMNLSERWSPTHTKYIETKEYLKIRRYRLDLDRLEKLVVQRLFELQKGHLESTGYKLRMHLAKHLKSRSEAIRTALTSFNASARALNPSHINLKFSDIIQHSFVGEFDLLRDARQDIRQKEWSIPSKRILSDQYYFYVRAKEEIKRLDVEIKRLIDWMQKEEDLYMTKACALRDVDVGLAQELQQRAKYQKLVYQHIRLCLIHIQSMSGYKGANLNNLFDQPSQSEPSARHTVDLEGDANEDDGLIVDSLDSVMQAMERLE